MNRSILSIRQMSPELIHTLIARSERYRHDVLAGQDVSLHQRRSVGLAFFENSTRTRVAFEQAAYHLGYKSVNFSASCSSQTKGETLKDTILTLRHELLDGLVMRHPSSGSCLLAERYFEGPMINAGDGQHEHPTQALGDALTILLRKKTLSGLRIAIVGDVLHSRVARSNAWLLSKLGNEVRFVGPRTLIPSHTGFLPGDVFYDLRQGIADVDVVMGLRLQRERMLDGMLSSVGEYARMYQINRSALRCAKPDALVMHPGPLNRGIELDDATADGPQSAIRDQVTNCMFVRMAVLEHALGREAS